MHRAMGERAMANFTTVAAALKLGHSVRRKGWEAITRAFILDGRFVCQRGDAEPHGYDLSWYEIDATDWSVIAALSPAQ